MNLFFSTLAGVVLLSLLPADTRAKPIAFSHGTTVMAEYGAGTMKEAQVFYAPKYYFSLGAGYLELESDIDHRRREITYARVNYLAKPYELEELFRIVRDSLDGGGSLPPFGPTETH